MLMLILSMYWKHMPRNKINEVRKRTDKMKEGALVISDEDMVEKDFYDLNFPIFAKFLNEIVKKINF